MISPTPRFQTRGASSLVSWREANETDPETVEAYKKHFIFEETNPFIPPRRNEAWDKILKKLPFYISESYEARLIKVRQ